MLLRSEASAQELLSDRQMTDRTRSLPHSSALAQNFFSETVSKVATRPPLIVGRCSATAGREPFPRPAMCHEDRRNRFPRFRTAPLQSGECFGAGVHIGGMSRRRQFFTQEKLQRRHSLARVAVRGFAMVNVMNDKFKDEVLSEASEITLAFWLSRSLQQPLERPVATPSQ
jgi:hypothetical protein